MHIRSYKYKLSLNKSQEKTFEKWINNCSICGYRINKLPLSIREWTCPKCNTKHNRDLNAASNIKKRGGQSLVSQMWFERTSIETKPQIIYNRGCQVMNPLASR